MTDTSVHKIGTLVVKPCGGCRCLAASLLGGAAMLAGCAHVPPQQQRLVSKPNMQVYGSSMFSPLNRLLTQFESSTAASVGGLSSGGSCSACGD